MLPPLAATALPESVTAVPAVTDVTDVEMLPKVTTGVDGLIRINTDAEPVCPPLSAAVNMKV
jgi:hypothetical protein